MPVGLSVGCLLSRLGLDAGRPVERRATPTQGFQAFTGATFVAQASDRLERRAEDGGLGLLWTDQRQTEQVGKRLPP